MFRLPIVIVTMLASVAAPAATLQQLSMDQMSQSATGIVRARVTGSYTSVISSTQLTAPVLADLVAAPGTAQVTVLTNTLTSNAVSFTISSGPNISGISSMLISG